MGVNRAGFAIVDDGAAHEAAKQEIVRRYFRYACDVAMGMEDPESVRRVEALMERFEMKPESRPVVVPARREAERAEGRADKGHKGVYSGAAVQLPDGSIVVGHNSPLLHAASAVILTGTKKLADIPDHLDLLGRNVIESIGHLRKDILGRDSISLNVENTLIALSISATTNPVAQEAMQQLKALRGCEMHMTHLPSPGDEKGLLRLGLNVTCDPNFATNKLFVY
jgi:uncharacterized protein (UPF0371 family)